MVCHAWSSCSWGSACRSQPSWPGRSTSATAALRALPVTPEEPAAAGRAAVAGAGGGSRTASALASYAVPAAPPRTAIHASIDRGAAVCQPDRRCGQGLPRRGAGRRADPCAGPGAWPARAVTNLVLRLSRTRPRPAPDREGAGGQHGPGRQCPRGRRAYPYHRAADRRRIGLPPLVAALRPPLRGSLRAAGRVGVGDHSADRQRRGAGRSTSTIRSALRPHAVSRPTSSTWRRPPISGPASADDRPSKSCRPRFDSTPASPRPNRCWSSSGRSRWSSAFRYPEPWPTPSRMPCGRLKVPRTRPPHTQRSA